MKIKIKNLFLDIFFPKFCLFCGKEGSFLCQDCFSLLEINDTHKFYQGKYLDDLYFSVDYQFFVKKLLYLFKYEPLIKELGKELSSLILAHFRIIEKKPNFSSNWLMVPVPLTEKKKKWRGFNQAEEIARELSRFLGIPLVLDCLIKIKETKNQVDLTEKERRKNIKNAFFVKNKEKILNKEIVLVDDVFTTGSTLEECARVLKESGVKKAIGIVVAKALPGKDNLS